MNGSAFFLIVVGLALIYAVITDKFYCFEGCVKCLVGAEPQTGSAGPTIAPSVQRLPTVPGMVNAPKTYQF